MSWNEKNNGLSKTNLCNLVVNKNKIFVCSSINGVSFSTDYGNNWTNKNKGVWDDNVISVAYDGKNLFAGTQQEGVFYSSNDGDTWIDRNKNIGYFDIYSLSFDGANLYSGNAGGIYITTNNGNLWTPIKFSHSRSVTQIEINNNHILALSSSSLFQSMDKGSLWDNNEIRVGQGIYNNCFAVKGSSIYLGTNSGVYISKDFCKTWVDASKDLGYKYVSSLLIVNDEIYAGTSGGGLFKAKISDLEIAAVHFNINNETQVVAPNPTSDFIEISVGANGPSPLQSDVRIFDVYGQTVSPAGGGVSSADGGGCIRIDVSGLPQGMYFVRVGDRVEKFVKI
jgi:ligand-binding sensor domain-containing protein